MFLSRKGKGKGDRLIKRNSCEKIEAAARKEPKGRRRLLRLTRDGVEEIGEGFVGSFSGSDSFMPGSPSSIKQDVENNLEEIRDVYNNIKDTLEDAGDAIEAIDKLRELDKARLRWLKDPEDIAKGVDFARKTAEGLAELEKLVPDSLPAPVKKYLTGLFRSIPNYVNALTGLLEMRIRTIDKAAANASGVVRRKRRGQANKMHSQKQLRMPIFHYCYRFDQSNSHI
jgi:hypothetical protein